MNDTFIFRKKQPIPPDAKNQIQTWANLWECQATNEGVARQKFEEFCLSRTESKEYWANEYAMWVADGAMVKTIFARKTATAPARLKDPIDELEGNPWGDEMTEKKAPRVSTPRLSGNKLTLAGLNKLFEAEGLTTRIGGANGVIKMSHGIFTTTLPINKVGAWTKEQYLAKARELGEKND